MSKFATELKRLRLKNNITLKELAKAVDVDYTYISKLENDKVNPPKESRIRQFAKVLHADPDYLILLAGKIPMEQNSKIAKDNLFISFLKAFPRLTKKQRKTVKQVISETDH